MASIEPGLQGRRHGRLGGIEREIDLRRQRRLPPVVRVTDHARAHVGRVARLHEPAGTGPLFLVVTEVKIVRHDDRVVVVLGQRVHEVRGRGIEVEGDRLLVHLLHPVRGERAAEDRQRVARVLRVSLFLDAVDHVVDRHRRAVVELHPLPDLERPHRRIRVGAPARRQPRMIGVRVVGEDQELADVADQFQATLVGDGDRVDRGGGHEDPRLDVRAGLARRGRAGAGRRRARAPACGQDATDHPHRQAHGAALADEVAARQPPGGELVDDVLLDRPAPPTKIIKPLVVDVTADAHEPSRRTRRRQIHGVR